MHDVFISYNSKDYGEALMVCQQLEQQHYIPCWMAPRDIPVNQDYADLIPDAIKQARFFLVVLSKNAMESDHVRKELELAIKHKCVIISYRLDNEPLRGAYDYHLGTAQWVMAENRQSWAIRETAHYIYDQIKHMPERDAPEKEQAQKDPNEFKRILFRVVLFVLVTIMTLIADRLLYSEFSHTGTYAGKSIILYMVSLSVLMLIIAPIFGGKRNMLLHFIDVIRDIILSDEDSQRKEDQ